ncbi:SRPBCC family protein [Serinicoccus marinus]|uniref:SRPBCC family protein n=1 Tax=Serinicoccus marinus TaxID=247333 RepID=UPI0024935810|nr:SRPBCC family protein [Serinicoccus marinus]
MTEPTTYPGPRIVVAQDLPVPADPVFEAWTDEAVLATWWWAGLPDTQHQVRARVGGDFAVSSQVAGLAGRGRFTRLDRPSLLQMAWRWETGEGQAQDDLVTVELREHSHGTLVVLTHEIADADSDTSMRDGWLGALTALAAHFPASSERGSGH